MNKKDYFVIGFLLIGAIWLALVGNSKKYGVEINPYHLIGESVKAEKTISTDELAKSIMSHSADFQLIDLRTPEEFTKFSLPGAINIPMAKLLDDENTEILNPVGKKNIFYSNGSSLAAKAWLITKRIGYKNNYYLSGGLNAWVETILRPSAPVATDVIDATKLYEERKVASSYFGGSKVMGGGSDASVAAPVASSSAPVKKKKSGGGGGCE